MDHFAEPRAKRMFPAFLTSTILILLTVGVHYEVLRLTSVALPRLTIPPRTRMLFVIIAAFFAHTVEVWLYAIAYYLFVDYFGLGHFEGQPVTGFMEYLYYSSVTYTSLGIGDIYPVGGLRLVSGVEALNGLVLIGWSASFTYLSMREFWPMHEESGRKRKNDDSD